MFTSNILPKTLHMIYIIYWCAWEKIFQASTSIVLHHTLHRCYDSVFRFQNFLAKSFSLLYYPDVNTLRIQCEPKMFQWLKKICLTNLPKLNGIRCAWIGHRFNKFEQFSPLSKRSCLCRLFCENVSNVFGQKSPGLSGFTNQFVLEIHSWITNELLTRKKFKNL